MNSINSIKGYGKVGEPEDQTLHQKSRNRITTIIILSTIILSTIVMASIVSTLLHTNTTKSTQNPSSTPSINSIQTICSVTQYPNSCISSLSSIKTSNKTDPENLFKLSLQIAINELSNISSLPKTLSTRTNDNRIKAALNDCKALFDDAIERINGSLSLMQPNKGEKVLSNTKVDDIRTWLSSAITNQETCLDGIGEISVEFRGQMETEMRNSTEFTSNCLAIATKILSILEKFDVPLHRKLLGVEFLIWVD